MSSPARTLQAVLSGRGIGGIRFQDLRKLLLALGFLERIRGSHHIFTRDGIEEIINLQPRNGVAKSYQVRQVRALILQYRLELPR